MSEHRDKAVEAAVLEWSVGDGETVEAAMADCLTAAEPHLQRMYLERFREVVLGEVVVTVAKRQHPLLANYTEAAQEGVLNCVRADLEVALNKALEVAEGSDERRDKEGSS